MPKYKLIFLGGGDLCRELLWTASDLMSIDMPWEPFGVLDDNVERARDHLRKRGVSLPVLGSIQEHQPQHDELFIPAIGNPVYKLRAADLIKARGGKFTNLLHPTALIAPGARLGTGIFAFLNSIISVGAQIDDFVTLNVGAVVGHDAMIGRGCSLNPGCVVTGNVKLGSGVVMGTLSMIAPSQEAGDFCTIGAGSAAIKSVSAGISVLGVPALPISPRRVEP